MPKVVSDTGPLIALASINQFALLQKLFGKVYIPPAVRSEILDRNTLNAINLSSWVEVFSAKDKIAIQLLKNELDAGESEAIVLARELNANLLVLDERAARRKAIALDLPTIGTLGVLLLAKKQTLISTLKPLLDTLIHVGFRMSEELYEQVLQSAGEEK